MTIYLYVKTHNVTGLKYLGKTSSNDPHLYPGSGIRWRHHLNKHGYNYTTEILKECQTTDEIRHWGLYYSDLYNVVESKEWANLKPEIGDGGGTLGEYNPNKQNTPESIAKQLETKKKNGTLMTVNEESLTKGWETRRKIRRSTITK